MTNSPVIHGKADPLKVAHHLGHQLVALTVPRPAVVAEMIEEVRQLRLLLREAQPRNVWWFARHLVKLLDQTILRSPEASPRVAAGAAVVRPHRVDQALSVSEQERLQQMIDELRGMRERCEPKSNQNPRYHRYSSAVSPLTWIIHDLNREQS